MDNKIKILLIEDNLDKCQEFEYAIQLYPHMEIFAQTGSEKEGLKLLRGGNADVVILDLELKEGNGIHLAEELRNMPISQPFVVVTTNNCSSSVSQYLRSELKVDFIFQKMNMSYSPKQVLDIIQKVYKYHRYSNPQIADEEAILAERIQRELNNMGFAPHHVGTDYLTAVFLFIAKNPDTALHVSKTIYPKIAEQFHTDPGNVERAIRTSIERVWSSSNLLTLSRYYPYDIKNKNGRPSNGEFIANMKLRFFGK